MKNINLDVFSSIHEPYWMSSTPRTNYSSLNEDIQVDVAIIGGGLVGITTAFLLKRDGVKVAVLEANRIGEGTTGHTTAKITSQHGLIYYKIKNQLGEEKARQYAEANEAAIQMIAEIVKEKNIDCDFSWQSAYVYTQSDEYVNKIEKEAKAAYELGIKATYLNKTPLPFEVKAAVRFDEQAQFHPRKYLLALAKEISGEGSNIFENTKVIDIKEEEKCVVFTADGKKVKASKVIVASHFPCYDGLGLYFARMYVEKSYIIGVKAKEKFPEGMFVTAEDPGRSLRSQKVEDGEIILIGGEHHKTGSESGTNRHYENLSKFAKDTFEVESILYRWSTQDCITVDKVPYIGYLTPRTSNIFVATGFRKWGMTNGTAAAMILTDLITRGENPWTEVYSPARFTPQASLGELVTQNLDVASKFVGGKMSRVPKDIEIKEGEAKVINIKGEKFGAYRDDKGVLHKVDITCTHLGCELVWNEAEKTWDCPCHGSRFSYDGANIEGPAFIPLKHEGEGINEKDANVF